MRRPLRTFEAASPAIATSVISSAPPFLSAQSERLCFYFDRNEVGVRAGGARARRQELVHGLARELRHVPLLPVVVAW